MSTITPKWNLQPKTPKYGYITLTRTLLNDFTIIYKVHNRFIKRVCPLSELRKIKRLDGFKYANVYDLRDRVQIASATKTKFTWLVKFLGKTV